MIAWSVVPSWDAEHSDPHGHLQTHLDGHDIRKDSSARILRYHLLGLFRRRGWLRARSTTEAIDFPTPIGSDSFSLQHLAGLARRTRRSAMPGFGRRYAPDDRDRNFLMRRMLADARSLTLPPRKTWSIGSTALNQGNTGTCVGHAWRNFLRCAPIRTERGGPSAFDVYRSAVLKDPWRDNDDEARLPDGDSGHGYGYDDPRRCRGRHRLRASEVVCLGVRAAAGRRVGAHDRPRRARHQLVLEPFTTGRRGRGTDHRQRPGGRRSCVSLARGGYSAGSRALLEFVGRRLGSFRETSRSRSVTWNG